MKLLMYSTFFAPSVGGVETIVASLARGLAERGGGIADDGKFEVTVVTETAANGFDDRSFPFEVVRQPRLSALWRLIRASDVVHIAGPALAPMFLAWISRKPYVIEHHGYQAICPNGVLIHQPDRSVCSGHFQEGRYSACVRCQAHEMPSLRAISRILLMFPRHRLAQSAKKNIGITQHVAERHRLPHSQVIYHGIEDAGQSSGYSKKESGAVRFAYVGRLVPEKGIDQLLAAAQRLNDSGSEFEVLLVGDGPERQHLEKQIERLKLEETVRITGFLRGYALVESLSNVDVIVMPSVWEETAGLAAIEQMMRGRVVIASKIGGLAEVVDGAGLLCNPGDAADLARCMKEVLVDAALAARLGARAREQAVLRFLKARMVDEHAALYQEIFLPQ